MSARSLSLPDGREVVIDSLGASLDHSFNRSFAVLVPAFNSDERQQVESLERVLIARGCNEFCCVGPEAEQLHDSLDELLEQRGMIDVVTTWHDDYSEACEYFVFAAGGGEPALLALIDSHPEIVSLLDDEADGARRES